MKIYLCLFISLPLIVQFLLLPSDAKRSDYWWDKRPEPYEKFSHKTQHRELFTNEENVTWRIAKDFRSVQVQRRSSVYTTDLSTVQLEIQYDNLHNTTVALFSNGKKVIYDFTYEKRSLVFNIKEQIRDQFKVLTNGTLFFHPKSSYQAGFTVDDDTGER